MSHIDTLEVYQDYIKNGYTEEQAICAVRNLNASFDKVVTTQQLDVALTNLKHELQIFFSWEIAGMLVVAFILPKIGKRFGWQ